MPGSIAIANYIFVLNKHATSNYNLQRNIEGWLSKSASGSTSIVMFLAQFYKLNKKNISQTIHKKKEETASE